MQQFIEFLTNHIMLFAGLAVVSGLLIHNLMSAAGGKDTVSPKQVTEMINREEAVVIDIRAISDFQTGHIINAINVPSNALKNQLDQLAKKHKTSPVVVACRSGTQSAGACKQLREAGFEKVFNMRGGMLAWQNDDLPVSKKK